MLPVVWRLADAVVAFGGCQKPEADRSKGVCPSCYRTGRESCTSCRFYRHSRGLSEISALIVQSARPSLRRSREITSLLRSRIKKEDSESFIVHLLGSRARRDADYGSGPLGEKQESGSRYAKYWNGCPRRPTNCAGSRIVIPRDGRVVGPSVWGAIKLSQGFPDVRHPPPELLAAAAEALLQRELPPVSQ